MKETLLRLPSRAALLGGVFALVSSLFGGVSVHAAGGSTSSSVSLSPRVVHPALLAKAGHTATAHHVLPLMHPHTSVSTTSPKTSAATASPAPRALQAASGGGFEGDNLNQQINAYGSDQGLIPPDNGTAVGGAYVVEFLNDSGWVYLRNNGGAGPVMSWDLNDFFVGCPNSADCTAGFSFSDPRVIWDPTSGRWFASGLAFTCSTVTCQAPFATREYVAVSSTSDPTGSWTVYTTYSSSAGLGDQPRFGVTSDKVVEFWDFYDNNDSNVPEGFVIINKANMLAGVTATAQRGSNNNWFGVVPAYDNSAADAWAVWNNTDGNLYSNCTSTCYFGVIDVAGAAGSATITETHLGDGGNPTDYPGTSDLEASQPGANGAPSSTAPTLDGDDDRVTVAAIRGSTLWATSNTECTPGTANPVCIRMFQVTTGSPPVLAQNVNISDAGGASVMYGAPAFDNSGNVVVGMSESSATVPASLAFSGETAGGVSFSAPALVANQGAGAGSYNDESGFDCTLGPAEVPCRWGDYSGAQPDVCDPTFDWISQEYAAPPTQAGITSNWGTWLLPMTFGTTATPVNCTGAPTVSAVAPTSGTSGCVNVTGTNFGTAAHVYFGNTAAPFAVNSATSLTANVPSGPSGTVDISVVNGAGDSLTNGNDQFTYTGGTADCTPSVTSVTPNTGPLTGERVVVGGAGFISGTTTVTINGNSANVVNTTASSMTVDLPAEPANTYDVRASNGGTQSPVNTGDQFTYVDGGYTLDAYGGVHPFGLNTPPPVRTDGPYWAGWKIARGMVVRTDRGSGYVLDGWGGVHPFGGAPAVNITGYWQGWDIARSIVLDPCDTTGTSGYVLDGWGGIHPFGPHAQTVSGYAYWQGWDIARSIVVNPCGDGGYTLDGWGGIHPFALGGKAPSFPTGGAYWQGWDIARSLVVTADGKGYELDGWGGIHQFGGAPDATGYAYWPGWDIARSIATIPGVAGGYTLDGWGGVHPFNGAPDINISGYAPGSDIYRTLQ